MKDLINRFNKEYGSNPNNWDWGDISYRTGLSEGFIREFQDKVEWDEISINQKLSEDFIREFQDYVEWWNISYHQKLSEDFIREFKDKVDWYRISLKQKLSEDFINKFKDQIDFKYLLQNPYCPPDIKFKYYKDNNMLTKEDPLKHSIEQIEEKKDNSLKELKRLVGI